MYENVGFSFAMITEYKLLPPVTIGITPMGDPTIGRKFTLACTATMMEGLTAITNSTFMSNYMHNIIMYTLDYSYCITA